jgi:hypothetical protein
MTEAHEGEPVQLIRLIGNLDHRKLRKELLLPTPGHVIRDHNPSRSLHGQNGLPIILCIHNPMKIRWRGQIVATAHVNESYRGWISNPVLGSQGLLIRAQKSEKILAKLGKHGLNRRKILKIALENKVIMIAL